MNILFPSVGTRSTRMLEMMSLLIYFAVVTRCQSEDLSQLSLNINRYAEYHFSSNEAPIENDFSASMQSIHNRLISSNNKILRDERILSDIYLLSDEVVLIRNALSDSQQKLLYDSLTPSISQTLSSVQVSPHLNSSCQCTLHTWKLNETLDPTISEAVGTLGEMLYIKAASFLNIQQAIRPKDRIFKLLRSPPIHQIPSFNHLYGILYGANTTLDPYLDKIWSTHSNSTYEWTVSISLGHSAIFEYRKNNFNSDETIPLITSKILLNSGDLIFFKRVHLEHSILHILKNRYPLWWYNGNTFGKAQLNIQYRLLDKEEFHKSQSERDVISNYSEQNSVISFRNMQHKNCQSLTRKDNLSDICDKGYETILSGQNNQTVLFSTSWMNRIFSFTQSTHEEMTYLTMNVNITGFSTMLRNYWPFILYEQLNNQRLAIMGIRGLKTHLPNDNDLLKKLFYESLFDIQKLYLPIELNGIVMSFSDPSVVLTLHKSGLLQNPAEFDSIFSSSEIIHIKQVVHAAMELINRTDSELYLCIIQSVSTFAFYKYVNPIYIGGTISSAIGLIWLDPSQKEKWTVELMAEQIVHEFIHTSLFINELVHTSYSDYDLIETAVVKSAIRRQLRNYDKSFHAAHVAAGLVAFLAKAGITTRAVELAGNLQSSINDLETVAIHTNVLSSSGRTVLQALKDFFNEGIRRGTI